MTTTCKRCSCNIDYEPIEGFPGIVPSWCEPCGEAMAGGKKSEAVKAEEEAKAMRWSAVCPTAYRLISEGGCTDLNRLQKECRVDWPDQEPGKPGLLITGNSGRGKTRWAWRAIRQEFDLGRSIVAFTPRMFEAASRDAEGTFKFLAFLESCSQAGAFMLDDLGKASWSAKTLETFYEIVEQRSSQCRPIFVTTNFTGADLSDQLKMDDGIMEPLIRRLREFCRCIAV